MSAERPQPNTSISGELKVANQPPLEPTVTVHKDGKARVMPSDDEEATAWIIATTRPSGKSIGA